MTLMNPAHFIQEAKAHLDKIVKLAEANQINWIVAPTPRPDAMKAFAATLPDYSILLCQANIREEGSNTEPKLVVEGMVTVFTKTGPGLVRMPQDMADKLYSLAAASRN